MKVLLADDNRFYRLALKAILVDWGYEVVEAEDGGQAWEILKSPEAPKIAILDWMMPLMDGLELCRRVRALRRPEPTYLMVLTALNSGGDVIQALQAGADDFLHKPFDRDQLQARLEVGKRIIGLQVSQAIVFTFARAVEAKSPYTQGHADRVTHYCWALATHLAVPETEQEILRRGALLHDIGKISIPETILNKPGKLTSEEFELIKQHPSLGVEIVQPLQSVQDVLPLVRWHHERLDGRGYPDGLSGNDIPFLVRVLSVCDVFDALCSARPYRPALPAHRCFEILREDAAAGGLDADLVDAFVSLPADVFKAVARPAAADTEHLRLSGYFLLQDSA
jgi:putative two-component system response regulator